ncbi:TolC family protein [Planctomycetota bacterium]
MRLTWMIGFLFIVGCTGAPLTDVSLPTRSLAQEAPTFQAPADPFAEVKRPTKVEPTGNLSLPQALALALLHNPQLEAYAWHWRSQEAAILQNHLSPNPMLGLKVENFGGQDMLQGFDGAISTLRISQAIELGDKRIKRTQLAQRKHALAAWDYEAQRLRVITVTGYGYIDALAAQHQVALAGQALALTEGLYDIIKNRTTQGIVPTVEQDKALVQVSARQIDLENQNRQLATLRQKLATQWASSAAQYKQLIGDIHDIQDLPTYDSLLQRIEQNPELARWATEISARQAAIELADAGAIPDLTLGAGLRRFNTTDNHALVFELGIPLPLVNRNQGAKRQARYDLQQTRALQRHAQTTAHATLYEMYQTLNAKHYAAITLRHQSLPAARAAFDTAHKAFTQGITDYLHVLDAERTLVATEHDSIVALAAYHKTLISLESFLGISLTTDF